MGVLCCQVRRIHLWSALDGETPPGEPSSLPTFQGARPSGSTLGAPYRQPQNSPPSVAPLLSSPPSPRRLTPYSPASPPPAQPRRPLSHILHRKPLISS